MEIEFLYWEDCPSHDEAYQRLEAVLAEEGLAAPIRRVHVGTEEEAARHSFPGSPTIKSSPGLTCRLYILEDGRPSPLPSREMIRRAVRAAAGQP